jgi:hypothetical protein
MSQPEWVEPHLATHRLAHYWDIPSQIAEQIVRGILQNGDILVRGRGRGLSFDTGWRVISKEIGATLHPSSMISWEFSDVEMDWNGLLKQGRNLVPSEYEYWVSAAIEKLEARSGTNRVDWRKGQNAGSQKLCSCMGPSSSSCLEKARKKNAGPSTVRDQTPR